MESQGALVVASLALCAAAAAQGFLGFGFGMLAMSVLGFGGDVVHAAGVVNLTGLLLAGSMALEGRHRVLWPLCQRLLPTLAVGVLCGVLALEHLERVWAVRLLGVSVLGIALWNLISPGLRRRESRALDLLAGSAGGFLSGAFNTGGPPLVIHLYRRAEAPEALRSTLQVLFVWMAVLRLPLAAAHGQIDGSVLWQAAAGAPAVLLGLALGTALSRRVPPERFRRAAWAALAAIGGMLLWRG